MINTKWIWLFSLGLSLNGNSLKSQEIIKPYTTNDIQLIKDFFGEYLTAYREPFSPADTQATIYLTFDDGPDKGSAMVAQIAEEEHIPVSFFMIGLHYKEALPATLKRYEQLKHNPLVSIHNHSYSHAFRNKFAEYYSNVDGAMEDIVKNESIYPASQKIVRLPGADVWWTPNAKRTLNFKKIMTLSEKLFRVGFSIIGWDGEWKFNYKTLELKGGAGDIFHLIQQHIKKNTTMMKAHFVLLMHERSFRSKESQKELRHLIQLLKDEKYRFAFVCNHPSLYRF